MSLGERHNDEEDGHYAIVIAYAEGVLSSKTRHPLAESAPAEGSLPLHGMIGTHTGEKGRNTSP